MVQATIIAPVEPVSVTGSRPVSLAAARLHTASASDWMMRGALRNLWAADPAAATARRGLLAGPLDLGPMLTAADGRDLGGPDRKDHRGLFRLGVQAHRPGPRPHINTSARFSAGHGR